MKRLLVALAATVSLSACATPYVGKPFDHAAAGATTLGLVGDEAPEKAIAPEVASVGSNFGLVGALVNAGIQASRESELNAALTAQGFDPEAALQSRLVSDLDAQGYKVVPLAAGPRAKRDFLPTYAAGAQPVDAYLDLVVLSYGYLSAGAGKPFRPTVAAKIRLVSAKNPGQTLMENTIAYNAIYPQKGVITVTANPAYAYQHRADMLADPKRTAAGLEDALHQVADTAAHLLR
jgi:hypothetical protein